MSIGITMTKILEKNNEHYYRVKTSQRSVPDFFVGLFPQERKIAYYRTKNLTEPICTVDLNNPESRINPPGISAPFPAYAFGRAYKAIEENDFPNIMGRVS